MAPAVHGGASVVPPGTSARNPFANVHRQSGVLVTRVDGIPVTTIAQTVADLCGRAPLAAMERATDDLIVAGRLAVADLEERAEFYTGASRRGSAVFGRLVSERTANGWVPTESQLESTLDAVLSRLPSQPVIVRQTPFPWRAAAPQRVDRLLPEWVTIVEADSRRWHTRRADFDRDRWRDNEAQAHGYRVLRFTYLHLTTASDEVIDLIERTGRRIVQLSTAAVDCSTIL
jgi:very-short-patch-repair endonuclease